MTYLSKFCIKYQQLAITYQTFGEKRLTTLCVPRFDSVSKHSPKMLNFADQAGCGAFNVVHISLTHQQFI
ncbi:hypothetical protein T10_4184 [Trichinella papuae]|uniref:Uncharacterized protein n=1 Tax=Trichinella papuae TaxID=268474 RepID=A0A0V1MVL1_9BILA|nr:hypothetical protein T10_4184 [Trichinella papuae]